MELLPRLRNWPQNLQHLAGSFSQQLRKPVQYTELELVLSGSGSTQSIHFSIEASPLAQRWARELRRSLTDKNFAVVTDYLFHGWLGGTRDLTFLCSRLNDAIEKVNAFFQNHPEHPYQISVRFDPARLDQEALNQVHHDFEVLIGQTWKPAAYYEAASQNLRGAIQQLNYLCHEIENLLKTEARLNEGRCHGSLFVSYRQVKRRPLRGTDFDAFSPFMGFGDIVLHYAQLGKTHLDAFNDRDEVIDPTNVNGLRYLSGEFDINFTDYEPTETSHFLHDFRVWMRERGLDPDDKKLAIGTARVARLNRLRFPGLSAHEILRSLHAFDKLDEIRLHGRRRTTARRIAYDN